MDKQQTNQTSAIAFSDNTANDIQKISDSLHARQLPTTGLGRAKDILPFLPFSKTTLFEWSKDGRFVAPVKLSPTMTAWSYAAVNEWINKHTSNTSEV
ncbi:helix-turn-helix transcriptional regulator [Psychrobacter glacincola]|uniref:Helix-turn-helix transcriptional regulator n=1 Tax=Psychrobacter glacincola TaxID=56810 RepID=A0ABW1W9A1_9GAMM|nr:AlpA family phage regulatory protein [Psychrobacter glacincola]